MFFKKSSTQSKEQAGRLLVELRYLIAMILLIGSIGLWPGHGSDQLCQPSSRRERAAIDDRNNAVEV